MMSDAYILLQAFKNWLAQSFYAGNAYNVYHHQLLYYADEILLINNFTSHVV